MSNDLKNIPDDSNREPDNAAMINYLNRQLSNQEQHELEKQMLEDPFMDDAMEGLEQFTGEKNINAYVEQLNRDLNKQLGKKKKRREKRRLKDQPWLYFTIILLLLLCIIAYVMIRQHMRHLNEAKEAGNTATSEVIRR